MLHRVSVVAIALVIGLAARTARAQDETVNVALGKHAAAFEFSTGVVPNTSLVDGDLGTSWVGHDTTDTNQILAIQLGDLKRIWRVVIHWAPEAFASSY